MEKFVPYAKLSKKARRAIDLKKRGSWGNVNPSTRTEDNRRAYKRHAKHKGLQFAD